MEGKNITKKTNFGCFHMKGVQQKQITLLFIKNVKKKKEC